ncbi:MAG: DegT/DnrJ/EryC1/StrS family aminotransferase, partial [Thermoplasmatota archaeon]
MIPISRPVFGDQEQEAVQRVLASGMVAHGPETEAFEQEFAAYAGTRHAVAVNSGTAALHVALVAAGVKPGDEVVTSPFTFVATVNAILMAGASPVFADIDPETFNLDPVAARAACTNRTTAIMPVHLFGQAADLGAFRDL